MARNFVTTDLDTLLEEPLPSLASAAFLFANAPAETKTIWLTLRTAGITVTTDGTTAPVAGVTGVDFAPDASTPYVINVREQKAELWKAIQNGGVATGYIIYRG